MHIASRFIPSAIASRSFPKSPPAGERRSAIVFNSESPIACIADLAVALAARLSSAAGPIPITLPVFFSYSAAAFCSILNCSLRNSILFCIFDSRASLRCLIPVMTVRITAIPAAITVITPTAIPMRLYSSAVLIIDTTDTTYSSTCTRIAPVRSCCIRPRF